MDNYIAVENNRFEPVNHVEFMARKIRVWQILCLSLLLLFFQGCVGTDSFLIIKPNTANGFAQNFTDSNLSSGTLTVKHNLDVNAIEVHVYDSSGNSLDPDLITKTDADTVTINLSSFSPISGTWSVVVLARVHSSHLGYFSSADLSSGVLTETHNLDSTDVGVQIWNDVNELVESDYTIPISVSAVEVGLASHSVSGLWSAVVLESQNAVDKVFPFRASDLDVNTLVIAHNLGTKNLGVYFYNDSGEEFYPDVQAVSDSRVEADLTGFSPITGLWYAEIFSTGGAPTG